MLRIKQFAFNPFEELTYVVSDESTGDAIVIDPGMVGQREIDAFDSYIADNKLHLTGIVNTHLHLDHCFGANYVKGRYGVPVNAHAADGPLGATVDQQASRFGMKIPSGNVTIDAPLKAGDTITVGSETLEVLHVPGHTPGGLAFYSPSGKFVIVGDSLFRGSIGRTDLPGGDHATLIKAIKTQLLTLPPDTLVLSGHGDPTTIGEEAARNPYLR